MSVIDSIRDLFTGERDISVNLQTEKQAPPQPRDTFLSTITGDEPPAKSARSHLKSYKQVSWIYKAVKKNSEKVAEIDLRLMKHMNDQEPEEINEHKALELLARVNDFMTFTQLVVMTQGYLELVGEAYWAKIRSGDDNDGELKEIWPLRPDKVNVKRGKDDQFIGGYVYKPSLGTEVKFKPEDIVYFKEFNPLNPFRGLGAVMAVAYAGDSDLFASQYNRNFFFNSAIPFMAILMKDTVGNESLKRFKSQWKANYGGVKNAHKTAILKGVEKIATDLQMSHKDMGFLDLRRFNRDEITSIFGVPKTVMGLTEDVNRANAEATTAAWLEHEIKPKMTRFADTLNEFLIRDFDNKGELFFDYVDPVPENLEHKLKVYKAQKVPWLTPNEIRIQEGMEPIDDESADRLWMPFNLQAGALADRTKSLDKASRFKSGLGREPFKKSKLVLKHKIMDKLKHHKKDLVDVMGSMMNTEEKIKEEKKEEIWKQFINITDSFEERYIDALGKLFNEQKQLVLTQLEREELDEESPFELNEETEKFENTFRPIILQLISVQGARADELTPGNESDTKSKAFDINTERIQRFLNNEGLKFAKIVNQTTRSKIIKTLSEGVEEGEGVNELSDRISEIYAEATEARSRNIARTEVLRASNFASIEAYEQDPSVEKVEWLTALDERVCPWCNEMNGEVIEKGESFFDEGEQLDVDGRVLEFNEYSVAHPPLHPQCRCTTIPLLE